MINFAVGPVPSSENVRAIGSLDTPYFRTPEFSHIMLENEQLLCNLAHAPEGSRAIFPTCSGTGAMEAAIMGLLDPINDKAIVVDGGSFGHRFRSMLELHGIDTTSQSSLYLALRLPRPISKPLILITAPCSL